MITGVFQLCFLNELQPCNGSCSSFLQGKQTHLLRSTSNLEICQPPQASFIILLCCYGRIQCFTFLKAKERNGIFIVYELFYIRERKVHHKKSAAQQRCSYDRVLKTWVFFFNIVDNRSLNHREPDTAVLKQKCCTGQFEDLKSIDGWFDGCDVECSCWLLEYYLLSPAYTTHFFLIHHSRKHLFLGSFFRNSSEVI